MRNTGLQSGLTHKEAGNILSRYPLNSAVFNDGPVRMGSRIEGEDVESVKRINLVFPEKLAMYQDRATISFSVFLGGLKKRILVTHLSPITYHQ